MGKLLKKILFKKDLNFITNMTEELNEFFRLQKDKNKIFLRAYRGIGLSSKQVNVIKQVETKIKEGKYNLKKNKCLCQADDDEIIAFEDRYGFKINTVICRNCGLIRLNPYYDEETLAKFYDSEYDLIYRTKKSPKKIFKEQQTRGGGYIRTLLDNGITLNNKTVYEAGCAMGGILQAFKNENCKIKGVDYNSRLIESGRKKGLNLETGGIEKLQNEPPADIIILSHLIEHILNPVKFLTQIKEILKQDGILYIITPTIETIETEYLNNIFFYLQNAHIYNFSKNTLKYLVELCGFEIIYQNVDKGEYIVKKCPYSRDIMQ